MHGLNDVITPVVLAGGKSSRMGTNKSFVFLDKDRLIDTIISLLQQKFQREDIVLVTNNQKDYEYLQVRMIGDIFKDKGPLGGLHAALSYISTPYIFMFACDMPFINLKLISYMIEQIEENEIIIPRIGNSLEPLHAIYSKNCLPHLLKYLELDNPRLDIFFHLMKIRYIETDEIRIFDPSLNSFSNINTRFDLQNAKNFLKSTN